MAFSLAACGDSGTGGGKLPSAQSGGNGSALSTDFQQHMKTADWFQLGPMCETETGWYFQYNYLLYYIDKKSVKTTVLCGKPDCKHADPTCNAWVNTSSLNYSDGKVFFDNSDNDNGASGLMTLFSMNTDGTSRKDVQALQQQKQHEWKPCEAIIHRGVVYFNYAGAVYMAPLGSDVSKATKLFGEVKNTEDGVANTGDGIYWKFSAEGDKIYFMGNITQSDRTQKDTLFATTRILRNSSRYGKSPTLPRSENGKPQAYRSSAPGQIPVAGISKTAASISTFPATTCGATI